MISFNVNGIRAITKKNFFDDLEALAPEVLCIQETKAQDDQVVEALENIKDYHIYVNSAIKKGYSGTAVLSRQKALSVTKGIGIEEHDQEGRVLTLEFNNYYLVNVYVPNSGSELKRLSYRQAWDLAFFNFLKQLEKNKPLIICGDFNVAHKAMDLARPTPNYNKSAGYMQEEIDGMDRFTNGGLIDTFRFFHPDQTDAYSWWSYRAGARSRNIGWRIDYFLVSEPLISSLSGATILPHISGSDHCPVSIELLG